jgi:hypothetical protein
MITSEDIPEPKPATVHVALDAPVMQARPRFSSFAGLASFLGVRK